MSQSQPNTTLTAPSPLRPEFWAETTPRVLLAEANPSVLHAVHAAIQKYVPSACQDCVVFSSSGTTGRPKLTLIRKSALLASAHSVVRWLAIDPRDRLLCALPLHHVGGFGMAARAHVSGAALLHDDARWDATRVVEKIADQGITVISLVPAQVYDLVQNRLKAPECLRLAVVGGGALAADLESIARDLGWPLACSFGMTEAASQIATQRRGDSAPAPGFLPVLEGWEIGRAENGCLRLRGPALFSGRMLPKENRQWIFEPVVVDNGWFTTTDVVDIMEMAGQFWVRPLGRADDAFKIRGELVFLSDLQALLEALAKESSVDPRQVVLLDEADARAGIRLLLVTENISDAVAKRLCTAFNSQAPAFARIANICQVVGIPRSPLGKLLKSQLRQHVLESPGYARFSDRHDQCG